MLWDVTHRYHLSLRDTFKIYTVAGSSKMSVPTYQNTWYLIQEGVTFISSLILYSQTRGLKVRKKAVQQTSYSFMLSSKMSAACNRI
jgi:hypothetical protein